MLSFGQEESGDCSSSICLERMVSRVSVTPQYETIAEAVDVIVYLKPESVKLSKKAAIFIKYHAPDCSNNKPIRLQGFYC